MPAPPRFAVVLALSFLLVAAPRAARAGEPTMKPEARAHLERGLAAYGEKDWARAIREFRAGYALDPRPDFLFAWAQAARLSGDCTSAIDLYQRFVATGPSPEQSDAAQKMTERCRETLAAAAPAEPAPTALDPYASTPPSRAPAAPAAVDRAWWKDGWGAGFTAAGVVGLGLGVGMLVAAGSSDDAATHAASYDEFAARHDEASTRRTYATIGLAAGGALLVTGGVRYLLVHHHHASAPASTDVALSLTPGAASLWLQGSF
jgi:hypothetical protein